MKPFSPAEARSNKVNLIPDVVIESVNEFLTEKYSQNGSITFNQNDLIDRILTKRPTIDIKGVGELITRHDIFANGWLDFESVYEDNGWDVSYDKPAYNETYIGYWIFRARK